MMLPGGNSKTLMLVNVAPTVSDVQETACSLQFASRVRRVELATARKSSDRDAEIEKLRQQVKQMQQQLSALSRN